MMTLLLRLLRVPCGDFGGRVVGDRLRWCDKPFGHSDSHAYEVMTQPLTDLRSLAQTNDAPPTWHQCDLTTTPATPRTSSS